MDDTNLENNFDDELNGLFGGGDEDFANDDLDDLFGGDDPIELPSETNELSSLTQDQSIAPVNQVQTDAQTAYAPQEEINEQPEPATPVVPDDQDVGNLELEGILAEGGEGMKGLDLNNLDSRALDLGEKADDAQDFDDISDDDLPEEEEAHGGPVQPPEGDFLLGIEDSALEDDDLFGDTDMGNTSFNMPPPSTVKSEAASPRDSDLASDHETGLADMMDEDESMTQEELQQWRMQKLLLERRADDDEPGASLDEKRAWLSINFPKFSLEDEAPFWGRLLPPRPGRWQAKEPKKPKPIRPTKVALEIEQDQKAIFLAPENVAPTVEYKANFVRITRGQRMDEVQELTEDEESDDELPNGLTMQDLEMMCTSFDTLSDVGTEADEAVSVEPRIVDPDADMFDLDDDFNHLNDLEHPIKKRKTGPSPHDIVAISQLDLPSFDDPEKLTAKLAREVIIDLNDSTLLVEEVDQEALKQRNRLGDQSAAMKTVKDRLISRFSTSNDAAYDMLKLNHEKKVRGVLTNIVVDHSIPAIRLQYPYYQVKLTLNELRNYHRRKIFFKSGFTFQKTSKLNKQKRKEQRTRIIREVFSKTKDLSLGSDNATAVLLEYSEEYPTMLSQTGMGNKIINYYRRTSPDDNTRPKGDLGSAHVLAPEDKPPFQNFGHVDPGETTTALHNGMFRAPIFNHELKSTDFLVVRETTGMNGSVNYLRNIDYMYVVGQELPLRTVPGTHSRMVTTASKNRLKAISFRIARRKKSHRIRVEDVTRHFPDTNDMQNRQKMKEFMVFSKEHKEWEMKSGELLPDEEGIQKLITPEEICLLESMQVGAQYLHDSGFAEDADDDDDDKEVENESIEQKLAPWKTTKNFLAATQSKAMLTLYGEGDPSGRGEAFSFIKTSMKGGFKAQGGSLQDTMNISLRPDGSHKYNVARQQKSYDESIRQIWDRQKAVLSSAIEPSDIDDEGVDGQLDNPDPRKSVSGRGSSVATPGPGRRRDDETATSFSKRSTTSQAQKFLRIVRKVYNPRTDEYDTREHIETDPAVIKAYTRRKDLERASKHNNVDSLLNQVPTGDPEVDAQHRKALEIELSRLQNQTKKPRGPRKSLKSMDAGSPTSGNGDAGAMSPDGDAGSPGAGSPPGAGGTGGRKKKEAQATQRKCANCGQVGHIKTNKKLCPLLNGTIRQDAGLMNNAAFMGAPPAG